MALDARTASSPTLSFVLVHCRHHQCYFSSSCSSPVSAYLHLFWQGCRPEFSILEQSVYSCSWGHPSAFSIMVTKQKLRSRTQPPECCWLSALWTPSRLSWCEGQFRKAQERGVLLPTSIILLVSERPSHWRFQRFHILMYMQVMAEPVCPGVWFAFKECIPKASVLQFTMPVSTLGSYIVCPWKIPVGLVT